MKKNIRLLFCLAIVLVVAICVLTACDDETYTLSTNYDVSFQVLSPDGLKTVNVQASSEEIINKKKNSKSGEYRINGDFDFSSIDDGSSAENYYLCITPFGESLGIEFEDYVTLSYAYANFYYKNEKLGGNTPYYYGKFIRWASFVKDNLLYLRRVKCIGDIKFFEGVIKDDQEDNQEEYFNSLQELQEYLEAVVSIYNESSLMDFRIDNNVVYFVLGTDEIPMFSLINDGDGYILQIIPSDSNICNEKTIYATTYWIDVAEFIESLATYSETIDATLDNIKQMIESDPSVEETVRSELESLKAISTLNPYMDIILYWFECIISNTQIGITTIKKYTNIPIKNVSRYYFVGYFDEENGNGIQYVDEYGDWLIFPTDDLVLYSYYQAKPIQVCVENDEGEITVIGESIEKTMPQLPQVDEIIGWYIAGTNIKVADNNGVYRPGFEMITCEEYQPYITEENKCCLLKLEYRYE